MTTPSSTLNSNHSIDAQNQARQSSLQQFLQQGWPSRKTEAWKYTNLKQVSDHFTADSLILTAEDLQITEGQIAEIRTHLRVEHLNFVFVNGTFEKELSSLKDIQNLNVRWKLSPASALSQDSSAGMDSHLENLGLISTSSTFEVEVGPDTHLLRPLHFWNFTTSSPSVSTVRIFLCLKDNAQASLIEESIELAASSAARVQNSFSRVELMDGAKLQYLRLQASSIQSFNLGRSEFILRDRSSLDSLVLHLGSKLARHELLVNFNGQESNANCMGGLFADGNRHVDNFTQIQHHRGGNSSQQLYKGIVGDQAKSIFRGMVYIAKDAQKANSNQLNNNLLLSSQAEAISLPQLQIYADDVKATHGATIGELSSEEIFYFQSRAISKEKAVQLLAVGFLNEVVYQMKDLNLQKYALQQVEKALQALKSIG